MILFRFLYLPQITTLIRNFVCSAGSMTDVKLFVFVALLPSCLPCCRGWSEKGDWRQPGPGSMYKSSVKTYKADGSILVIF